MMEVLRSTNIVFNAQTDDTATTNGNAKPFPYKKDRGGSEEPRVSKTGKPLPAVLPPPGGRLPSVTPPKGISQTSDYESMKPDDTSPYKFIMGPSNTPMSLRKRISPADSGIEMTPGATSPFKVNPKLRTMYNSSRRDMEESTEFSINPDPVPYQASNFLSSTTMKKVPMSRRHLDNFGTELVQSLGKRGVFLHTDRYQWDLASALDGLSQRERLQAELEYMEKLRGIKRRREVLPHRARLDLLMGGKKVEFCERFDIQREIQKLRSLILPQHAKDLYHGRGFLLPDFHNSVKPRKMLPHDIDLDEELASPFSPDKYSINPETGRVQPKWQKSQIGSPGMLPKISNKGYLLGHGTPVILSKEKRTVESIKARLRIPTSAPQPAHMTRSKTNVATRDTKQTGARSLTAYPNKKDAQARPTATAPSSGPTSLPGTLPAGKAAPVKIPVSARDPEDTETVDPQTSDVTAAKNDRIAEEPETEEWPEVEEVLQQPDTVQEEEGRTQASSMSNLRSTAQTPNPLKGVELPVTAEEQNRLKQTFNKLDTDKDGHIKFSQLQTQLPSQFSQAQERYIKQVYDITSSSTFFGVDEFMTMSYLTSIVTNLRGEAQEAYSKLDFTALHDTIIKYLELYQSVDRGHRGKINLESLQDILCTALPVDLKADTEQWNKLVDNISLTDPGRVSKIDFLAHIPYFLCIRDKK